MKFSINYFFTKFDQIRRKLWIWSHLLKKSLMENFIFCAVSSSGDFAETCRMAAHRISARHNIVLKMSTVRKVSKKQTLPTSSNLLTVFRRIL